jgi:hypothetical protein
LPLGQLFPLGHFLKIAQITQKIGLYFSQKWLLGYFWACFSQTRLVTLLANARTRFGTATYVRANADSARISGYDQGRQIFLY